MGKGDRKTRRGKIYAGSFGKLRPKDPAKAKARRAQAGKAPGRAKGAARK